MKQTEKTSRRTFVRRATVVSAGWPASASLARGAKPRPSERVNVGLIGIGIRGYQLHEAIKQSQHAQVSAIADLSDHYIERIRERLANPRTPIHRDYRAVLDDGEIDAVVIATPDHWHASMAIEAMDAGKDVYVEKPLAYSFDEAIRVRDKARSSHRVTQVGYQRRTLDHFRRARDIVCSGQLGEITQIQLWSSRNRDTPPWRAFNSYTNEGLPAKSARRHVDWRRFQANRPPRPYDPRRFFHWQCYEEYSTGIFGILMSHPLDAANLVMDLEIPETCSATGGIFKYDDGRTVPDTCNALFNYPSRRLTISFIGSSNNTFLNQEAHYRGTHGTMELGTSRLRVYAEKKNALYESYVASGADDITDLRARPVYEAPAEYRASTLNHLDDFFKSTKSRKRPAAPIEECFKAMVAVAMAIESYKTQRTVHWDGERERLTT